MYISLQPWNSKMVAPWMKSYGKPSWHIKKLRHHFANKGLYSQNYGFSSSHIWTWELDNKEGWVLKNWCFQNVALEKTLERPLDYKEIKPSILKEIKPEYSLEGLMLKLQYFAHMVWRADSLEKTLMLGLRARGKGVDNGWDGWMASLSRWKWV